MVLAIGVLVLLLLSVLGCFVVRAAIVGWILLAFSALWLPASHKDLTGPTLFGTGRGVTLSDMLGFVTFAIATVVLAVRAQRGAKEGNRTRRTVTVVAVCCLVFSLGAAAAWLSS